MQIKTKLSQRRDLVGEFDISDYCLGFDEKRPLRQLNIHWDALVHFCKTLDAAQDHAKQAIAQALSDTPPEDVETSFVLESELESARLAEETLVKATIFIVLCSFKEFALKEIYRQLEGVEPLPSRGVFKHIKSVFMAKGIWPSDCESMGRLSPEAYETIRNNFAHGDWAALKEALPKLELHDEFLELIGFLREIRERLNQEGQRL